MAFRKFAAHYVLMPDGILGKWPVVEMDDQGMVVSVAVNPGGFQEQPSLQYHSGILLPGFVDAWAGFTYVTQDQRALNRHLAKGTLVLSSVESDLPLPGNSVPPFLIRETTTSHIHKRQIVSDSSGIPILERLLSSLTQNPEASLAALLYEATALGADHLGLEAFFGRIRPGLFSGLLIMENIDLQRLLPMPQTRVRWLVQPQNPLL